MEIIWLDSDVAEYLHTSREHVNKLTKLEKNPLRYIRVGDRMRRFRPCDVEEFLKNNASTPVEK
jgi:excisionase family DNA binding protein